MHTIDIQKALDDGAVLLERIEAMTKQLQEIQETPVEMLQYYGLTERITPDEQTCEVCNLVTKVKYVNEYEESVHACSLSHAREGFRLQQDAWLCEAIEEFYAGEFKQGKDIEAYNV